jgi:hypothetical protein
MILMMTRLDSLTSGSIPGLGVRKSKENRVLPRDVRKIVIKPQMIPPAATGKGIQVLTEQVNKGCAEEKYTHALKLLCTRLLA